MAFIGLNPSTADETEDDPTVRRCINFAMDWGYDGMVMLNAFAFRATDPKVMKTHPEPVGPDNDAALKHWSDRVPRVVACWGTHGAHQGREAVVRRLIPHLSVLGLTKDGHPKHPLYLPKGLRPVLWA